MSEELKQVIEEMRARKVGSSKHGKHSSQTLLDWADRIESALATPPAAQVQGEREAFEAEATRLGVYTCDFVRYDETTAHCYNRDNGDLNTVEVGDYRSATLQDCWKMWQARAALSAPPAAGVPDGWKLVPSVISPAMVDALRDAITVTSRGTVLNAAHAIYAAIEAAPTPPASEQQQAVVLPERREHPSMSMYAGFKEYATAYGEVSGHNDCLDQIERLNPHLAGVNQGVTVAGNGGDA